MATGINHDGEGVGMLQIVRNSSTINHINQDCGGAWNKENIWNFLKKHNSNHLD